MPVFHTKTIESILDPVAQQVSPAYQWSPFRNFWIFPPFLEKHQLRVRPSKDTLFHMVQISSSQIQTRDVRVGSGNTSTVLSLIPPLLQMHFVSHHYIPLPGADSLKTLGLIGQLLSLLLGVNFYNKAQGSSRAEIFTAKIYATGKFKSSHGLFEIWC